MGPSARLRAVQELLEPLCEGPDFLPVDQALSNYFRKRRYIGSKDRRAIRDTVYLILHAWQPLAEGLRVNGGNITGKSIVLAFLKAVGAWREELFQEGKYGLEQPTAEEAAFDPKKPLPEWASLNCPEWLFGKFQDRFQKETSSELDALNTRASVDIRINTLKPIPDGLDEGFANLGFQPGKRLKTHFQTDQQIHITHYDHYKNGHFEFQDGGSQIASLLVGAKPGEQVLDLCAGAGGKTLALAAEMQNKGQIFAYDISDKKLKTLKERAQRAGARNIQVVTKEGFQALEGKMDRVLLDVPCSGTGVWRRKPDSRLRLTPEKLETYKTQQKSLLKQGFSYLKPGGVLVYVTCSLLPEENEDQIEAFLAETEGLTPVSYSSFEVTKDLPTLSRLDWALQLSPASHGTDGFFIAIMEKKA